MTQETAEKAANISRSLRELTRHIMWCQDAEVDPRELLAEFIDVPAYRERVNQKIDALKAELAAL